MKANLFFALVLILAPISLSAQTASPQKGKAASINQNEIVAPINDIRKIKNEFDQKISSQQQLTQALFNGVSAQLSAFNNNLVVFSICIILIGFFIGAYVTHVASKIAAISEESKKLLETHKSVKEEVENLNEKINRNLMGLYAKIKEEETKHMIARLERVPKDIANLVHALMSRELSKDYYSKFKKTFLILKNKEFVGIQGVVAKLEFEEQYLKNYAILLFQHFADLALFDDEIASEIQKRYVIAINAAFENDITKSTGDLIRACVDNDLEQQKDKVRRFFGAVYNSQYRDFSDIYETAYAKVISKQNRFLFYELLKNEPFLDKARYEIALRLIRDYKAEENTESQKLVLTEMDELIKRMGKK